MGKALLLTVIVVPVFMGMQVAKGRRSGRGLGQLLAMLLAFDLAYMLVLYYLRRTWL